MKRINVIDLDKTLIPYDSFRRLVKSEIKKANLKVMYITLLRVIRIISSHLFKEKVIVCLENKYKEEYFKKFAQTLYLDIDPGVLKEIKKLSDKEDINILLSASPDSYVSHLIHLLGWKGTGSYFDTTKNFVHMYGSNKINWLEKSFDRIKYNYNLAISDSSSDDGLLRLFKKRIKWILP